MKLLVLLSLVALCYARYTTVQVEKKFTIPENKNLPYQAKYEVHYKQNPFFEYVLSKIYSKQYYPEYQQPYVFGQQYQQLVNQVPVEFHQWFNQVPVTHPLYQYMLQYQQYYQQGLYPIVFQIYEQFTPAQTLALESLIEKIGFQNVEVLFNYFIGNHFYFAPEQYQLFVSVIEKIGYQYVEQFFQQFVGQKFFLKFQQRYVTFKPTFSLEYTLKELEQYTAPEYKQYSQMYSQNYPEYQKYQQRYFNQVPVEFYQWFSRVPVTHPLYQYMLQYQQYYQQGLYPIVFQIYEQLTLTQIAALENLFHKIGFQNVEVLFNYFIGNHFYFTPEQYQVLFSAIEKIGYPYVEQFFHEFVGQKFFLVFQDKYVTFKPTFTLEYILKELQQYNLPEYKQFSQYYGQNYPAYQQKYQYQPIEFQQWFSEVPMTHPLYKYMLQYQQYYQQGLYPIVFQIYEQLTPAQTLGLETLVEKIGFQNVEVLFNYFVENHFYFTPEQYQILVSAIEKVGYPYVEQFFQGFVGQKFFLKFQQKYVTFKPVFTLEYILKELQQYNLPEYKQFSQYYGQNYPVYQQYQQKWFNQVPVEFQQWFSQVPITHPLYKYIFQYQQMYKQGLWPVVFEIYEQLTPAQIVALENLFQKIGFQNVEVLFNYFIGNHFYLTAEQYQSFVYAIESFGYQYVQQFFQPFIGEKFFLVFHQKYVTFRPVLTLEYILKELEQYIRPEYKQYSQFYGQNYSGYQNYPEFFQKYQPYYKQSQDYQNQYQYYPYQYTQGYQGYQPFYQQYQYPQIAY